MTVRKFMTWSLLSSLLLSHPGISAEPARLLNNPFSRPNSEANPDGVATLVTGNGPTLSLDLKATLVGTRKRMANVAGVLMNPGDEIQGYRLISVQEDRAVFERNGEFSTVFVKPILVDADE